MKSASTIEQAAREAKTVAQRVLDGQRIAIGVILVVVGIVGFVGLLWPSGVFANAAQVGSCLAKGGFLYPLLKGSEVLMRVYLGAKG